MTITREFLDRVLPDDETTQHIAEHLSGLDLSHDVLGKGLRWLSDLQENDSLSAFRTDDHNWRSNPRYGTSSWWNISFSGLQYKGAEYYLTLEGWPLGTRCWYVHIECGNRSIICAETPELAIKRGIIMAALTLQHRNTEPDKREDLSKMAEDTRLAHL